MNEGKDIKWLKDNWFKILIIVFLAAITFLLAKGFVFTPEATYNAKRQDCLLAMKKMETVEKEYDSIISTPEYASSTDKELRNITDGLINALGYRREDIYECWAFLEAEGIDYSIRYKANEAFR